MPLVFRRNVRIDSGSLPLNPVRDIQKIEKMFTRSAGGGQQKLDDSGRWIESSLES